MYAVKFVGASDLPEGHDWVLAQDGDANVCALFVKEDAVCPEVLQEAWDGFRRMVGQGETLTLPEQRTASLRRVAH